MFKESIRYNAVITEGTLLKSLRSVLTAKGREVLSRWEERHHYVICKHGVSTLNEYNLK
jgi:hypothetical protein